MLENYSLYPIFHAGVVRLSYNIIQVILMRLSHRYSLLVAYDVYLWMYIDHRHTKVSQKVSLILNTVF